MMPLGTNQPQKGDACSAATARLPRHATIGIGSKLAVCDRVIFSLLFSRRSSLFLPPQTLRESAARSLDAHQRDVIKRFVLREAKASIVSPHQGEPHDFAAALASALRAAGAWVADDQRNSVEPGTTGLTVAYDHGVPADSSIFLALQRAGLNPKDEDIPGAPVAT